MTTVQRRDIDHDPVVPWNWATMVGRTEPVEIVSYPDLTDDTVFVRMTVGDPTSARWVPLKAIAAFTPSRHEWCNRPRRYYSDNPTAFVFCDEAGGVL